MYRNVARWEKACTGEQCYTQEGSVIVRRRVALYTGGQRDYAHEGSVIMHMRVALYTGR